MAAKTRKEKDPKNLATPLQLSKDSEPVEERISMAPLSEPLFMRPWDQTNSRFVLMPTAPSPGSEDVWFYRGTTFYWACTLRCFSLYCSCRCSACCSVGQLFPAVCAADSKQYEIEM